MPKHNPQLKQSDLIAKVKQQFSKNDKPSSGKSFNIYQMSHITKWSRDLKIPQ